MAPPPAHRLLVALLLTVAGCTAGTTDPVAPTPPASVTPTGEVGSAPPDDGPATAAPPTGAASRELPTRVVIPELAIDLPVLSGDATLPGNPRDYPLCGVAQYLTTYRYLGRDGATTWIYAHAREGMFLPLLEASTKRDGAALLGMTVDVYSTADRRHRYQIVEVLRHALDRGAAADVPPDARRLVLQTSEGPNGTVPKLQVVAELVDVADAAPGESTPVASPSACFAP